MENVAVDTIPSTLLPLMDNVPNLSGTAVPSPAEIASMTKRLMQASVRPPTPRINGAWKKKTRRWSDSGRSAKHPRGK